MKKFLLSILFLVGVSNHLLSADFYAVGGLWSNANSWASSRGGAGGAGVPGPNDNVFLEGNQMFIFGADAVVNNVNVLYDVANQITIFGEVRKLTINGVLRSYDLQEVPFLPPGSGVFAPVDREPNTNVIIDDFNLTLEFTRNGQIFQSWGELAPIANMEVNTTGTSTISSNIEISGGNLSLLGGNLSISSGISISDSDFDSNLITIASTTLTVNGAIYGNSNSNRFNSVDIQGNLTTGTSGYINADNFTLGASSTFTINFNGANQTEGWWYQSAGPTGTFSLDPASTVIYNASADQVVGAQEYGNLRLRSPSSASVKSLQSTGNLLVQGLLRLNSANVTFDTSPNPNPINIEGNVQNLGNWAPTQLVIFSGTTPESINGANQITFAGGLRVSNTSGLTLNNIGIDINGELDIDPSCSFDPTDQVVTVSGNMRIDGDLIAGTNPGGFIFDGTTEFLGSGSRAFYDFTIDASGSVNAPPGILTVHRNWTNEGVFDNGGGTVAFTDIPIKSISGSSTTSFWNLSAEGGTININGNVDLENVMSFAGSPTVDLDGTGSGVFTLLSSETRDAAIDNIGTATLDGTMNVQRAIYTVGGDNRGYHIVGFPVSGLSVSEIQDELSVTGPFTGASACPTAGCTYSIYAFDEVAAGNGIFDNGYTGFPSSGNGESFTHGEGYYIFNYAGEPASGIIEGNGTVFSGDFNIVLSRTGSSDGSGWHMVSNPYPAPTDWSQWDRSGIDAGTAYLYNPSSQAYEPLDGAVQQLIPQGQGIFVRATTNGAVLSATEATKVTGTTPTYYRTLPQERFEIILKTPDYDDITIVSFNQNATDNYEPKYDAVRLLNTYETISTLTEDNEMVKVNRLAPVTNSSNCSRSIKLNLEQMVVGDDYALDFSGISTVSTQELILKDNFLNTENQITDNLVYNFQVTDELASKGSDRFEIILNSNQPSQISTVSDDVCPQQNATIVLQNTETFVNYLISKGDEVVASVEGNGADANVDISTELLASSINDFTIQAFVSGCDTTNVGNAQVQVYDELILNQEVSGSSICSADNQASFSINTQLGANYYILDGQDTIQSVNGTGSIYDGFISVKDLNSGLNEFTIAAEKDACQSGTLQSTLEIKYQDLVIDENIAFESNDICIDNSASIDFTGQSGVTYSVYQDGTLISSIDGDGTNQSIVIDKTELTSGSNEFTMKASYGSCSEFEFSDKVIINVEEEIVPDLDITNANSCGSGVASVIINNAQNGKTYNFVSGEEAIVSKQASQDGKLIIEVPVTSLTTGLNQFDILIEGQNCTSLNANQVASVNYVESAVIDQVDDYSICLNETLTIDLSANVDMDNYQLFLGDELLAETNEARISISPEETTTYTLTGSATNSCEVNSINFTVSVTDISQPGILVSNNVLESSIEGDSYQWYLNGELLEDETNKLIVVTQKGDYELVVTQGNCSATSEVFSFDQEILKANELLENSINLYPNPVSEKMFIDLNTINSVNITIFTLEGKFIDSFKLEKSQTELDMTKYSNGTYLMQFESDKGSITKRIIKQ
ncbi:T9SS type A sorting domain-containing protein [Marivirga arenosa]|uniref:T9SS type A sorting domain-containing protein n=1 Tax=Marivirga arenosa TaxID=3059076 RepID=A0AA51N6P1_9BACT|nr:T9SS type A sorting domain-containing protein [Marivirga sp. ABR2-2]WMN07003.1 T9SS type A sorting domain-containing protein [Marivirga sp. ABR2-2]